MTYDVVVRKEHCENTFFGDDTNCAICKAVREQLGWVKFSTGTIKCHRYDNGVEPFRFNNVFGLNEFNMVLSGKISEFKLTLMPEEQQSRVDVVKECDATVDAKSTEDGYIKEFSPVTYKKIKESIPELSNS